MRIRHACGSGCGAPAYEVVTLTATNTWAVSAVCDSSPASLTVPTEIDLACLTSSMKGCDRLAKSS